MQVEYKVKEVTTTKYEILRLYSDGPVGGCTPVGIFEREEDAREVQEALEFNLKKKGIPARL